MNNNISDILFNLPELSFTPDRINKYYDTITLISDLLSKLADNNISDNLILHEINDFMGRAELLHDLTGNNRENNMENDLLSILVAKVSYYPSRKGLIRKIVEIAIPSADIILQVLLGDGKEASPMLVQLDSNCREFAWELLKQALENCSSSFNESNRHLIIGRLLANFDELIGSDIEDSYTELKACFSLVRNIEIDGLAQLLLHAISWINARSNDILHLQKIGKTTRTSKYLLQVIESEVRQADLKNHDKILVMIFDEIIGSYNGVKIAKDESKIAINNIRNLLAGIAKKYSLNDFERIYNSRYTSSESTVMICGNVLYQSDGEMKQWCIRKLVEVINQIEDTKTAGLWAGFTKRKDMKQIIENIGYDEDKLEETFKTLELMNQVRRTWEKPVIVPIKIVEDGVLTLKIKCKICDELFEYSPDNPKYNCPKCRK